MSRNGDLATALTTGGGRERNDQSEMRAHLEGTLPMSVVSVLSLILPYKQTHDDAQGRINHLYSAPRFGYSGHHAQ